MNELIFKVSLNPAHDETYYNKIMGSWRRASNLDEARFYKYLITYGGNGEHKMYVADTSLFGEILSLAKRKIGEL